MRFLRRRKTDVSPLSPPTSGEPSPSHWDAEERELRDDIADHGWLIINVEGDSLGPGFQFTVGLTAQDLPEMIVYGLAPEGGMGVLNEVAQRLLDGEHFADGEIIPDVLEGEYRTQLWDAEWLQDPLGAAFRLYGEDRVRVRQLVVPDLEDRLPWEDGFADPELQPVLFQPPNGQSPRPAVLDVTPDENMDRP